RPRREAADGLALHRLDDEEGIAACRRVQELLVRRGKRTVDELGREGRCVDGVEWRKVDLFDETRGLEDPDRGRDPEVVAKCAGTRGRRHHEARVASEFE